jgi:hypothetical protein
MPGIYDGSREHDERPPPPINPDDMLAGRQEAIKAGRRKL